MIDDNRDTNKIKVYRKYPKKNIITYNLTTILHFTIAGIGLIIGYNFLWGGLGGYIFGMIYLVFAFTQMYIIMPLVVCPNCVYYKMKNSVCTSALNLVSKRIAKEGNIKNFENRAIGPFSHNKMYMGSLITPIFILIPALILNFSFFLLLLEIAVIILLLIRFFIVFQKTACPHCSAKYRCPNAKAMGIVKN
jgi:hypothetical protein